MKAVFSFFLILACEAIRLESAALREVHERELAERMLARTLRKSSYVGNTKTRTKNPSTESTKILIPSDSSTNTILF
jgi:hypothetical protein